MKYKPTVLIIEDDPLNLDVMVRRMSARGFRAVTAASGTEGLAKFSAESDDIDLILLDLMLPDVNGMTVLRQIRHTHPEDVLPIIVVSARTDAEDVIDALDAGANDYVTKPIHFPVLIARIRAALRVQQQVALLIEAESQRVTIESLRQSAIDIAKPMAQVIDTLESLMKSPPKDSAKLQSAVSEVLNWAEKVVDVIERLQDVGKQRAIPYTQELGLLDEPILPNQKEPS
jgi:DNA-binding response OmpR family regulator